MMAARHPYRRGDVVLVRVPFSDLSGNKERPVLVLSTDTYHDNWNELLVTAITAEPPKSPRLTDYELQAWRQAGLHQPSWIRSHLATVHRRIIACQIGTLTASDLAAVESCLRVATGL